MFSAIQRFISPEYDEPYEYDPRLKMAGRERWDRDRFEYEKDRARMDADKYSMRGGRGREHSEERFDRLDRRYPRGYDDDMVRDRRYYDEESRYMPRREPAPEYERRAPPVVERERERDTYRRSPSPQRPAFLRRRQSSLDTFDRRPIRHFWEQEREEYPPPARREDVFREEYPLPPRREEAYREEYPPPTRREDAYREEYRAPPYTDIPLPKTKTKALPPPRRYEDRYYDDIKVAEPEYYGDEDFRPIPERMREREYVRSRERRGSPTRSHSTRTHTHRSSSPSSATTSSRSSSSSSGGTTIKSEYPKKGKTRIPARLVSKRAIIDIGYPFTEEVS